MKIIALVRTSPGTNYFVNRIHRSFKVSLAICEELPPLKERIKKKFFENGLSAVIELGLNNLCRRLTAKKHYSLYNSIFGDAWYKLDTDIEVEIVEDINSNKTKELLLGIMPDIVIVRGTSIIRNEIIESVPLTLNLHAGLSPYYRGTHCSEWALINWDSYNIGSTLHKVAPEIDGGDILGQMRIDVEQHDIVESIEAKMCFHGTSVLLDALAYMKDGKNLLFHSQDLSIGYLTLQRQWSIYCQKQINHIEKNNLIAQMLKTPSRGKLPINKLSILE
jgi:folate-dependent phosphoribosylglycinamide formyltransferase PurN